MRYLLSCITSPFRWFFRHSPHDEVVINSFSDWFGSVPGFKQQMVFMLGWTAIAVFYPAIDPNMFHLMAFLTLYSGLTQPLLAIQNARSGYLMVKMIQTQQNQIGAIQAMLKHMQEGETHDSSS